MNSLGVPLLQPATDFLRALQPEWTDTHDASSSLYGGWFLSPERHVVEYIAFNGLWACMAVIFLRHILSSDSRIGRMLTTVKPRSRFHAFELGLALLTFASLALRYYHLLQKSTTIFLLQPCHLYASTLLLLPFLSPRLATIAFNTTVFILWGCMLAIVFPDLRDYKQPLELGNFWVEHGLVIVLPLVYAVSGKYPLMPFDFSFATFSFTVFALYHSLILNSAGLIYGKNLNYMLAPPPGPLVLFGSWYRVVMYAFCFPLTVVWGAMYGGVAQMVLNAVTPRKLSSVIFLKAKAKIN